MEKNIIDICMSIRSAIQYNKIYELEELLKTHPYIMSQYSKHYGFSMMQHAVYSENNISICELLSRYGADVNETTDGGRTVMEEAATKGDITLLRWLISKGAKVDGDINSVLTPLSSAIIQCHPDCAKLLIEKGANIDAIHRTQYKSPLDYSRIWGQSEIEKILIAKNAIALSKPTNWKDEFGGPLLRYVNENAGTVLPISLSPIVSNTLNVNLRIAQVNNKKQKYLFTIGLFKLHKPMIELSIVLPEFWNFNDISPRNFFPCELLFLISQKIKDGTIINEGDFISCQDESFSTLSWAQDILGFWVCDYKWNKNEPTKKTSTSENSLTFYTLIPVKDKKGKIEPYNKEKLENLSWGRIVLPL